MGILNTFQLQYEVERLQKLRDVFDSCSHHHNDGVYIQNKLKNYDGNDSETEFLISPLKQYVYANRCTAQP